MSALFSPTIRPSGSTARHVLQLRAEKREQRCDMQPLSTFVPKEKKWPLIKTRSLPFAAAKVGKSLVLNALFRLSILNWGAQNEDFLDEAATRIENRGTDSRGVGKARRLLLKFLRRRPRLTTTALTAFGLYCYAVRPLSGLGGSSIVDVVLSWVVGGTATAWAVAIAKPYFLLQYVMLTQFFHRLTKTWQIQR